MALAGGTLCSTCVLRCRGAYFSLDAAPFTAVHLRFAASPPPGFEIRAFPSQEHTGIGANFQANLLQIWARIRQMYERMLGGFQSKLWP